MLSSARSCARWASSLASSALTRRLDEGYIRKIPTDPFTKSDQTWIEEEADFADSSADLSGGIIDVRSGSMEVAMDGSNYGEW